MVTTATLRKIARLKHWEATNSFVSSNQTLCVASSTLFDQYQFLITASITQLLYDPREDSYTQLPSGAMSTTNFAATHHPNGPTGTASAGSATTITTTTNLPGGMAGYVVRITAGTGAGQERTIASNTFGANSVLTVTSAWTTNPDNTSVYLLLTGQFWVVNNTTGAGLFKVYDLATNTWTSKSTTGLTVTTGQSSLTASYAYGQTIASGTATSATATTLSNSGKVWTASQWINYQVRITGGLGAGQVRTITANTGTALTVATWTTTPDSTSTYVIEGNDDFLYFQGGNVTALYRYSISGNSWSAMTSSTGGHLGGTLWVGVASDSTWASEADIKNGRYLYAPSTSGSMEIYDIPSNTWVSLATTAFGRGVLGTYAVTPGTGYSYVQDREFLYILPGINSSVANTTVVQIWRFNCVTRNIEPVTMFNFATQNGSTPLVGNRAAVISYNDGGTVLRWLYYWPVSTSGSVPTLRMMVI